MDTQRIIALVVFLFSGMLLWQAWDKHNNPTMLAQGAARTQTGAEDQRFEKSTGTVPVPSAPLNASPAIANSKVPDISGPTGGRRISVTTDTLKVELNSQGGDIRQVTLLKHAARGDATRPFVLMQDKVGAYFVAQSGLGQGLPNHTSSWTTTAESYELGAADTLEVILSNSEIPGLVVEKKMTFRRGSYVIDVGYEIRNNTGAPISPNAYFRFLRDSNPPEGESAGNMFTGVVTYTGPAIYTDQKKFQKVDFSTIDKKKQDHAKESADGWIAVVQHYFVSAWLPADKVKREYFTDKVTDTLYSAGVIIPVGAIASGASAVVSMPLYVGPQEQEKLKQLAPGLDMVVDYGWLTVLAYPMFTVLSWIDKIVGNWGWTIVIFTILLKLVFFPLNQKAGKSMAHMKHLAPKVEALKARYGDDKLKLNQAMMELYKTEKINPLGGCLPILIQMPFLIAMYWVLLGAVELRNAPWIGWITDLSTPDPFYVLPVIMGASMLIQTKLNPTPPDPVQAKVMLLMPIVFSVMFFFFPAGLVLYWTMQNILGIGQQWYINKTTSHLVQSHHAPKK